MMTSAKLFKKNNYPSWSLPGIVHKDNVATNWKKYLQANMSAGLFGTGYKVETYKKLDGVKKTVVNKFNLKEAA